VADEWYAGFLRRLRAPGEGEKFTQEDIDNIKQRCASYTPGESHLAMKHNAVADAAYAIVSHKNSSKRHSDYASVATWRHHVGEHHPMPDKRLFTGKELNGGPPPPHAIMPQKMELFVGCPVKAYVVVGGVYTISTDQSGESTHRKTMTTGHYYANRREVRGIVTEMSTHGIYVRCSDKEPLYIEPISVQKVSMKDGRPTVAAQWNGLPAWAEPAGTVHSVQGQTKHDQHHVFIDGAWDIAMIYVALSRTRHPSLVHLVGSIERLNDRFYTGRNYGQAPDGMVLVDKRVLAFQEDITKAMKARKSNDDAATRKGPMDVSPSLEWCTWAEDDGRGYLWTELRAPANRATGHGPGEFASAFVLPVTCDGRALLTRERYGVGEKLGLIGGNALADEDAFECMARAASEVSGGTLSKTTLLRIGRGAGMRVDCSKGFVTAKHDLVAEKAFDFEVRFAAPGKKRKKTEHLGMQLVPVTKLRDHAWRNENMHFAQTVLCARLLESV
jgi:hypothetical protein